MRGAVFRFAPSPNGRLHLGHAYSALLNRDLAAAWGGQFLLRIEDIDPVRATPETIAGVEADLAWLGLAWPRPVRRQSRHMAEYGRAARRLRSAGLLYPCRCSRGEIAEIVTAHDARAAAPWPRDPDGSPVYPGTCRPWAGADAQIAAVEPPAWRLDMAAALARLGPVVWTRFDRDGGERVVEAQPARWGDPVIVRKDVPTSYHLSVVLDDALQGVTHVVRGLDLEAATDIHAVLQALLGLRPPLYQHHALVLGRDGAKLSKSKGSESLATIRDAGVDAATIRRQLGFEND